jgi:hypothetical protein
MNSEREKRKGYQDRVNVPCPTCGHPGLDLIIWDDPSGGADFVTCLLCGTRYNPITGELQPPF